MSKREFINYITQIYYTNLVNLEKLTKLLDIIDANKNKITNIEYTQHNNKSLVDLTRYFAYAVNNFPEHDEVITQAIFNEIFTSSESKEDYYNYVTYFINIIKNIKRIILLLENTKIYTPQEIIFNINYSAFSHRMVHILIKYQADYHRLKNHYTTEYNKILTRLSENNIKLLFTQSFLNESFNLEDESYYNKQIEGIQKIFQTNFYLNLDTLDYDLVESFKYNTPGDGFDISDDDL